MPEGHELSDILFDPKLFQVEDDEGTKDVSFAALLLSFTQNALETGTQTLQRVRDDQQRVLAKVQWMYQVTFAAGVISFIAAVYKGFTATSLSEAWPTVIFGGLSGAVFVTIFIVRPAEAIERANVASVWISLAMNSYWIRMALSLQPDDAREGTRRDRRLEDATDDILRSLRELLLVSDKSDERLTAILRQEQDGKPSQASPPEVTEDGQES
ncbi:MAG: hypothetical protein ACRDGO_01970 [Actinomycetota bacterium]